MVYVLKRTIEKRKKSIRLSYQSRKLMESLLSGKKYISDMYSLFSFRNNLYKSLNNLREKEYVKVSTHRPRTISITEKGKRRLEII